MRGSRVNPLISGVATIIVVFFAISAIIVNGLPGGPPLPFLPHGVKIKVALTDADALAPHAAVQIAGVKIGEVQNVDLASDNTAIVTMSIDPQYADIHADAIAKLRPHGLFGPKFIDLVPGNQAAPLLHDGDTIPGRQTVQPVDLDQVLQELRTDERVNLETALVELGKAAEGRGDDANHLFAAARSLTLVLDSPVKSLGGNVAVSLNDAIVQDEAFNASFAQAPLDKLLENNNKTLVALAANSDHLQSILVHANSTLGQLDQAITGNVQTLRSTIEQLPAVIDKLDRFNDLIGLFAANFTGKDPTMGSDNTSVTIGLIGAIENIRSSFLSFNPCTPGVGNCPADGKAHYVRQQIFNQDGPVGNPITEICALGKVPILGGILKCPISATVHPAQDGSTATVAAQSAADPTSSNAAVLSSLLTT